MTGEGRNRRALADAFVAIVPVDLNAHLDVCVSTERDVNGRTI